MPKSENQKLKLLYLMQIFLDKTDADHPMTLLALSDELKKYDIKCERKTLYEDIKCLDNYGLKIEGRKKDRTYYYYAAARRFSIAELKLLVDSVQSSMYLSKKTSDELIRKLESLTSEYDRKDLQRQVHVDGRVKNDCTELYNSIDKIHHAIADHKQIRFQYCQWDEKKELVPKYDGIFYRLSPLALNISKDRYYLIAYSRKSDRIMHYRVDKMLKVSETEELWDVPPEIRDMKMDDYISGLYYMHSGAEETVTLECANHRLGPIIDEFGRDITIRTLDADHAYVRLKVVVSKTFIEWLFTLGPEVTVTGSRRTLELIREEAEWIRKKYLDKPDG